MIENHTYNLMAQMVEESKSLWRIKNDYLKDEGGCADCDAFWKKMIEDKEAHIKDLTDLIKKHLG